VIKGARPVCNFPARDGPCKQERGPVVQAKQTRHEKREKGEHWGKGECAGKKFWKSEQQQTTTNTTAGRREKEIGGEIRGGVKHWKIFPGGRTSRLQVLACLRRISSMIEIAETRGRGKGDLWRRSAWGLQRELTLKDRCAERKRKGTSKVFGLLPSESGP